MANRKRGEKKRAEKGIKPWNKIARNYGLSYNPEEAFKNIGEMYKEQYDKIIYKPFVTTSDRDILLCFLSDMHLGYRTCAEKLFYKDLQMVMAMVNMFSSKLDVRVAVLGDVIECASTKRFGIGDEIYSKEDQVKRAVAYFEPFARMGKLVCWLEGNHERRFIDDQIIFSKQMYEGLLDAVEDEEEKVGRGIEFPRYIEGNPNAESRVIQQPPVQQRMVFYAGKQKYVVLGHHGWGGARMPGSKVNTGVQMSISNEDVDLFIRGHVHTMTLTSQARDYMDEDKQRMSISYYMTNMGYVLYENSYGQRQGYLPQPVGFTGVLLSKKEKRLLPIPDMSLWRFFYDIWKER